MSLPTRKNFGTLLLNFFLIASHLDSHGTTDIQKFYHVSKPEMVFNMMNIITVALRMCPCAYVRRRRHFHAKTMIDKIYIPLYYKFVRIMLVGPTHPVCLSKGTGCPKKNAPKIVWITSPATNMLDRWDISHLKGGTCSSVWSTETFLYHIWKPRYKQNKMGCQISRIWNDE